ncbi:MAG: hypothetical protein VZR24_09265 [Butyrivibrio hungatei]|nr:hypothetical protein [Butyrivibrio hungatei]
MKDKTGYYSENFTSKYLTIAAVAIVSIGMMSTRTMHARNDYSFAGMALWSFKYIIIVLLLFVPCVFFSLKRIHVTEEYIELGRVFKKRHYYNKIDEWMYLRSTEMLYLYTYDKEYKISLKHIRNADDLLDDLSGYIKIQNV